nr:hypothetical protein [Tanacetum cinerariifolium]
MTTTVVNNSVCRAFFEKQRLTGPNFIDWYRNLWIVLSVEEKLPVLEQPIPAMSVPLTEQVLLLDVLATHAAWVKASMEIAGLMLMTMKLEEGQSVSSYVLKMKSYIDNLERLSHAKTQTLALSLILVSLRKEYNSFVQNYNMHGIWKTVTELHSMLKLHEQTLPKKDAASALHAIRAGKGLRGSRKLKPGALSLYIVYLLKHKHKVFETFKVFQKEVENQLRKTIKSLHSDRGGEYMSQEFLDHLKEHGIISHRTPPYTPQHNGVSERRNRTLLDMDTQHRIISLQDIVCSMMIISHHTPPYTPQHNGVSEKRNRTLLDMVRSMMSQTTLPKSFWDYALESAACILNMVLSKNVEKTPYEKILKIIQEEDTHPCVNTSLHHDEDDQEINEPQSDINPIRRAIRILVTIAAFYDCEIWQMDVKTAFLNRHLSDEVYMVQPEDMFLVYVGAEYIATYDALKEAVWIRKFISRLGFVPIIEELIRMYCDNTRAITIANESKITKGARHYHAKVHYLRKVIELGDIKLEKVYMDENLADPFTKALPLAKHSEHTQNIGMLLASSLM